MREDVRGVGKPLDAPKDPSANLGNFSPLFGTSQSRTVNAVVIDRIPEGIYAEGLGNTIKYLRNKGLKMADDTLTEDSVL